TDRKNPSPFYQSFVAGGIKLDIRRLRPNDVISIALGPERQEQQNVRKIRGLSQDRWESLVNAIDENGNATPLEEIAPLLDLDLQKQEAEALAARGNMTAIVRMLHDKSSQLMDMLIHSLSEGKLCIIDVSQMRGGQSLVLSGLILRRIFDRNQQEFTSADPKTIPTIAVVEEAQSVLNEHAQGADPYIAWVKEGRKYDLGALLITQQPGSIPVEILSQGDNWFIFHLLSATDLMSLKRANAHFSDDLLSSLLNEPIPGQGIFWSSVGGKAYPISLRVQSFEAMYTVRDPDYNQPPGDTYASLLRTIFSGMKQAPTSVAATEPNDTDRFVASGDDDADTGLIDVKENIERRAIELFRRNDEIHQRLKKTGMPWFGVQQFLMDQLPEQLEDRRQFAYNLVIKAMNAVYGPKPAWRSYKNPDTGKTWVQVTN
ncbi:MAG: DUF87 domain-containing protein, partial [Sulfobacillus sp.]|nr:DUF87 domain-containing protein [Sulfobacillus sp.]